MIHKKIVTCINSCVTVEQAETCRNFIKKSMSENDKDLINLLVDEKVKAIHKANAEIKEPEFRHKSVEIVDNFLYKVTNFLDKIF